MVTVNSGRKYWYIGGTFFVLLLVTIGSIFSLIHIHAQTFYPNVKIAGLDVGGKTRSEVEKLLSEKVHGYIEHKVRIVIPDTAKPKPDSPNMYEQTEIPVTSGNLGLVFENSDAINRAWSIGHTINPKQWLNRVPKTLFFGYTETLSYRIDSNVINTFINTQVIPKIGNPVPPKITISGTQVFISNSIPGFEVKKEELAHMVSQSFESATDNDTTYLQAPVSITESSITKASLQPLADTLNVLGNLKVSLTGAESSLNPDRAQLLTWFAPVQDEKEQVSLAIQKEVIGKYISSQKNLELTPSLEGVTKELTPLLASQKIPSSLTIAVTAKPTKLVVAENFTPGKFEGKYVEIQLANQKMYLVNGTKLEKAYTVSSGKWSTPTPVGTFKIQDKIVRAYSAPFGLYLPYWQNFLNGEYGLHELPEWPNGYKEGQSHLGIPVSHGCVRLGIGDAKQVYDWTETGTPVYIH